MNFRQLKFLVLANGASHRCERQLVSALRSADSPRCRKFGSHCVVACRSGAPALFGLTKPRSSRLALQAKYARRTHELFTDKLLSQHVDMSS